MTSPAPDSKILVVGSLPPPDGARSMALREEVVRLLGEGHTVEVLAPDPVATAHRYLSRTGFLGCIQLARRVGGFDSVVVQLQPGLPVKEDASWWVRALCLRAFSIALRRAHHVVLRIEDSDDLPGGTTDRAALRMWSGAAQILIGNDELRQGITLALGPMGERVTVGPGRGHRPAADSGGWGDGQRTSAETVLELVRGRAAQERRETSPAAAAQFAGWERLAIPGAEGAESRPTMLRPPRSRRKLGELARLALASAERRLVLRPLVSFARFSYHKVKDGAGPDSPV